MYHYRDGIHFERLGGGTVRIMQGQFDCTIDAYSWASIIAHMADPTGFKDIGALHEEAVALHANVTSRTTKDALESNMMLTTARGSLSACIGGWFPDRIAGTNHAIKVAEEIIAEYAQTLGKTFQPVKLISELEP